MRTIQELKDIVLKLEIIEEMKEPLQSLLADFNTLLQKGKSWIENSGNETYQEIKQLLEIGITDVTRQSFSIANIGQRSYSESALTSVQKNQASNFASTSMPRTRFADENDSEHIFGHVEELTANLKMHSELLKEIQQKIENHEEKFKSVSKVKLQTNSRFEDIMQELHEASNFMSSLSEEMKETKEIVQIQDEKIQEVSRKVENYLKQKDSIAIEKDTDETLKKEYKSLTDELGVLNATVNDLKLKLKNMQVKYVQSVNDLKISKAESLKLKQEKAQAIQSLKSKESEIVKLREEIATANEAIINKGIHKIRLIAEEDIKRCIEISIKGRGLDDNGNNNYL